MNISFFEENRTKTAINSYRKFLEQNNTQGKNEFEKKRNEYIEIMLKSFEERATEWDLYCQINIDYIGKAFLNELTSQKEESHDFDEIYAACFRFLLERHISNRGDFLSYSREIKDFSTREINKFSTLAKEQIEYALRDMPLSILKEVIQDSNMGSVKEFITLSKKSDDLIQQWNNELKEKEDRVNHLKEALNKYENAFNFVGLYDGFKELSEEKLKEKNKSFWLVLFLASMVLAPLTYEVWHLSLNKENFTSWVDYFSVIPMFSITIILIYYFKISLQNHNSIKAQLSQIELRKTLCRFIQKYGDYSAGMKKQDPESLSKFENIIFSSIITNGDNIPATFDGLEQIAKIIGNLKNSK